MTPFGGVKSSLDVLLAIFVLPEIVSWKLQLIIMHAFMIIQVSGPVYLCGEHSLFVGRVVVVVGVGMEIEVGVGLR
jgi:hypothetical protein